MSENQVQRLYNRLCTLCVFRRLLETPLFASFLELAKTEGNTPQGLCAYGNFVENIYRGGGNLSDCVRKAVFEDENIYVTTLSADKTPDPHITESAMRELDVLSEFAALSHETLQNDMKTDLPLAGYTALEQVDLCAAYTARLTQLHKHGYGMFASHCMFRLSGDFEHRIEPIVSADTITMDAFIGYHSEREQIVENTRAFVEGRPAANALLYGDAGTGKSSTVKAVANYFYSEGLRLIELRKDQMAYLPFVMEKISGNPLKFIIFIDDLSFNRQDDTFSMLKAALEGSASAKAPNAVIYATSNRRHIVREGFGDRDGDEVHRNDTMQELLSLSARFGLTVQFGKPDKKLYLEIVRELAAKKGIETDPSKLEIDAEAFALRRGHRSARCAEQFIDSLL